MTDFDSQNTTSPMGIGVRKSHPGPVAWTDAGVANNIENGRRRGATR